MRFSRLRSLEFVVGAGLTGAIVLAVLCSGILFPDGGDAMDLAMRLVPPFASLVHPFGTDPLGRDVLARVVVGGQISLTVGVLSVAGAAAAASRRGHHQDLPGGLKTSIRPSAKACGDLESAAYSKICEHLQEPHNAGSRREARFFNTLSHLYRK